MDKIYSRTRLVIPKLNISIFHKMKSGNNKDNKIVYKLLKICIILSIAVFTFNKAIEAINPITDKQCQTIAKSIATKISNEQATIVMSKYKYDDLCNVVKDSNRKYSNDKCKCNNCK